MKNTELEIKSKLIREMKLHLRDKTTYQIISMINFSICSNLQYSGCELNESDSTLIIYIYTDGNLTVEITRNNNLISETTFVKICIGSKVVRFWHLTDPE